MGCVTSQEDRESEVQRERRRKRQRSSKKKPTESINRKRKRRKKRERPPLDEYELKKKSDKSPKSHDSLRWKDNSDSESSRTSIQSRDNKKTRKKRSPKSAAVKYSESKSSVGSSTYKAIPQEELKAKSDDKLHEPLFIAPDDIFFGGGQPRLPISGTSPKVRRLGDLRPSTSGCSGKCSQHRSKMKSLELEKLESIKRLSNKCQCPSRVKIEFCQLPRRRKERKPSTETLGDDEANTFTRITGKLLSKIKKNCQKLKDEVFPVLKKKSKRALRKIKKGYTSLSESQFFAGRQNCGLEGCGSGVNDCTSRASIKSYEKSAKRVTMSGESRDFKKKQNPNSPKSSRSIIIPSNGRKFQICECEDNPNKVLIDNLYSVCCCTDEDFSGNTIKKGCC